MSAAADPPKPESSAAPSAEQQATARRALALLREKCSACHGAERDRKGELDLRTREAALAGGESGEPALVPHEPARSTLVRAIEWKDPDLQMPPKANDRLTADDVALMRQWIADGAHWPDDSAAPAVAGSGPDEPGGVRVATSGGITADWTARRYAPGDLWAWQPLRSPAVPRSPAGGARHPIDAFVDAKLRRAKITPAPPAERRTLIRRATLDLTGLMPTPEAIAQFEAASDPASYARLLDSLLASPHYGEQMAQHWLDVVRYADTDGFSNDFERPHAWRYRDYVIRSFNADKPYDRFIVEQIAGDELAPDDPEMLVAVGFLRMGPWEQTAMSVAAVTRQMFLDDVTNSVGVTFLAQGMSCCRCHDHKFDPLPTRDYYALQAVFAATKFADRPAAFLAHERPADATAQLQYLTRQEQADALKPLDGNVGDALNRVQKKREEYLKRAGERYEPLALSVANRESNPVFILTGGRLESPTDVVTPGILSAMASYRGGEPVEIPAENAGRRLALARWIANEENTLTARVIVNRVWQQHFGTGLVATPNNFGKMGKRPTHPELLDWLAAEFIRDGWSLKKLHRLIMTSAAYQRSASHDQLRELKQQDANNELLAYYPSRRLTAEELRDSMLLASGELSTGAGGPGVFADINREVALQPRQIMGGIAPAWQPSRTRQERNRRTIYTFRARTLADPLLEVFNRPGSDASCERREASNVPTQAFELWNGEFARQRALALAAKIAAEQAPETDQLTAAFRQVLGRGATPEQLRRALAHLSQMREHHAAHKPVAVPRPKVVVREMIAEQSGELFRWDERLDWEGYEPDLAPHQVEASTRALAEVCHVLFNSNEFLYVY